jgi:hypothetical protein
MSEKLAVKFAFLCDDVRREDNGKFIFIGVYGENIVTQQLPNTMALSLVLWVEAREKLSGLASFRISLNGQQINAGSGAVVFEEGKTVSAFQGTIIAITHTGELKIEFRFGGEEWETILTTPVLYRPVSVNVSIERPQPS